MLQYATRAFAWYKDRDTFNLLLGILPSLGTFPSTQYVCNVHCYYFWLPYIAAYARDLISENACHVTEY